MLKKIIVTSALLLCSNSLFALDCEIAQVGLEGFLCAEKHFKVSDKKLNALYKQLIPILDTEEKKALIKQAQLAWIQFKEADCQFSAEDNPAFVGGAQSVAYFNCLKDKTDARIAELKIILDYHNMIK